MTTITSKTYRIEVETVEGRYAIWYEKSRAKNASTLITDRVYEQLCGLGIKRIEVKLSVPMI